MRFSLQDIKKHVQRRGNLLSVSLHFLRSGELRKEIERLVSYHEQLLDHPQRDFSIEDARACIGDYRLAHCLITTLSAWYHWQQRDWQIVVKRLGNDTFERFQEANIASPAQLRLALFNFVNERYDGFLAAQTRDTALKEFAGICCGTDQQGKPVLAVQDLEYLLTLDSDEEAVLVRDTPHAPDAEEVASLYNQWVFEAALFNASDVHFAIDCNAFVKMQDSDTNKTKAGVGAVIKRLCYVSRKLGVYYDLEYDSDSMVGQTSPSILHLTLYGPQEMTGTPQQYGLRLAKTLSHTSWLLDVRSVTPSQIMLLQLPYLLPLSFKPKQRYTFFNVLIVSSWMPRYSICYPDHQKQPQARRIITPVYFWGSNFITRNYAKFRNHMPSLHPFMTAVLNSPLQKPSNHWQIAMESMDGNLSVSQSRFY